MIAIIEPTAGQASAPIYHLKVVLMGTKPPIWRRLQVPGNANLGWLHAVLQVAMGWTNSHLHQFKAGGAFYSDPRHHFAEYEGDPEILDESKVTLQQLVPRAKGTLPGRRPSLPARGLRRRLGLRQPAQDHQEPKARGTRFDHGMARRRV